MQGEAPQTRFQQAYYDGFLVVLIGCFAPTKILPYALPALFVGWLVLQSNEGVSRLRLAMTCYIALGVGSFYYVVADEFLVTNFLLSLVTYSTFLPLVLIDSKQLASRRLLIRLLVATSYMVLVQGTFGTIQAVYGATQTGSFAGMNGDRVEGTIHPQLWPENAFANPMFATNMSLMLLACLSSPELSEGRRRYCLMAGIVSLVLASVVHVLIFLGAALLLSYVLTRPRQRAHLRARPLFTRGKLAFLAAMLALLGWVVAPGAVASATDSAKKLADMEALEFPRAILLYRVFTQLPDDAPEQPWVGLGPGQFSSRASLIASGTYLGGPGSPKALPLMKPKATRLADDYCFSLLEALEGYEHVFGSTQQPFFSLLSVYTELGLLGLALIAWIVFRLLRSVRRRVRANAALQRPAFAFCSGALLVFFLGLQENYWEVPQAILIGALLFKCLHANILHRESLADRAQLQAAASENVHIS